MVRVSTESPSTSHVCWGLGVTSIFYELHDFCMVIYCYNRWRCRQITPYFAIS